MEGKSEGMDKEIEKKEETHQPRLTSSFYITSGTAEISSRRPIDIFRSKARAVRIVCSACLGMSSYVRFQPGGLDDLSAGGPFFNSQNVYKTGENEKLEFDPGAFKRKTGEGFTWPKRALPSILKPEDEKTDEDIEEIANLMQHLDLIRKLKQDTQYEIARCVEYTKVGSNRVILRQGHRAVNFYIIFSGAVKISFSQDALDDRSGNYVVLRRGCGFGEIGLLHNVPRTANVSCLRSTELMMLNEDHFFSTGLAEYYISRKQRMVNFVSSIKIFADLPSSLLELVLKNGQSEKYLDGQVIVRNSAKSEHLWFVADGSCDVFYYVDQANEQGQETETTQRFPRVHFRTQTSRKVQNGGDKGEVGYFVKAGHLVRNGVFGVLSLVERHARPFSLVSRGAEVFRIPKDVVTKTVPMATLVTCAKNFEKYPSDSRMFSQALVDDQWKHFKRSLVNVTVYNLQQARFAWVDRPLSEIIRPHTGTSCPDQQSWKQARQSADVKKSILRRTDGPSTALNRSIHARTPQRALSSFSTYSEVSRPYTTPSGLRLLERCAAPPARLPELRHSLRREKLLSIISQPR